MDLEYRRSQLRYYRGHRPRWESRLLEFHLLRKFRDRPVSQRAGQREGGE
jgi:hypothetical protein